MKRTFISMVLVTAAVASDFDTGMDAPAAAKMLTEGAHSMNGVSPGWLRLRGIASPAAGSANERAVNETRAALKKLHAAGQKVCVLIRWAADWRRNYLPPDLREAYENGRRLGAAYGNLVDAWEIDNEPDLAFVPESAERFAAYLKATNLGLKAGMAQSGSKAGSQSSTPPVESPRVLMGSLGLPPGPWLERFAENDGFSFTDGFNYHYYGYAEDFTGVYRQHQAAVQELSLGAASRSKMNKKTSLPVFLTEIGYGMLGKQARETNEGRLRQWRWFRSVAEQATGLRIEAPMAFFLPPYLEYDNLEFGLTVPGVAEYGQRKTLPPGKWSAGGIVYSPAEFGAKHAEPWMELIGRKIADNYMTPALAQWLTSRDGAERQNTRSWDVEVPSSSPVVIDFLGGEGLWFVKRFGGNFVTAPAPIAGKSETESVAKFTSRSAQPAPVPVRSEEFIVQVRTANGNLYEVYPTRLATETWQQYLEPQGNFTMSFYGRAGLPWRFAGNKPISLVAVMYPKSLPATYEFRQTRLVRFGYQFPAGAAIDANMSRRYGRGTVVLYNFSDREIQGKLLLPEGVVPVESSPSVLSLLPGERREVEVAVEVPAARFTRIVAAARFVPDDVSIPPARYVTSFMPDLGGMVPTASMKIPLRGGDAATASFELNQKKIGSRQYALEEAPMSPVSGEAGVIAFAQVGALFESIAGGFAVTVTAMDPGKPQRAEVEIPWPDNLGFGPEDFLSFEFRLRPQSL